MTEEALELDVRPILAGGSDPFAEIMEAVAALRPGQDLRIVAPFRPAPLVKVLGSQGFTHRERALSGGDWEMTFSRREVPATTQSAAASQAGSPDWPAAVRHLDTRELDPPEPMVRILAALETMAAGEVLSADLAREPMFLFPELAKRGHAWRGGLDADGRTYRLLVRMEAEKQS